MACGRGVNDDPVEVLLMVKISAASPSPFPGHTVELDSLLSCCGDHWHYCFKLTTTPQAPATLHAIISNLWMQPKALDAQHS